jgi:hypothetical protein
LSVCNTSSLLILSVQIILSVPLQRQISKFDLILVNLPKCPTINTTQINAPNAALYYFLPLIQVQFSDVKNTNNNEIFALLCCYTVSSSNTLLTFKENLPAHLTLMGPCIVIIFYCISNKMQRHTVYFIWKLLYMFRMVPSPIIRSANNCNYSIWYLSHRYCYLPLSWFECAVHNQSWNWFDCPIAELEKS